MRITSLAQLPRIEEVRNDSPIERVEAREVALRVELPTAKIEGRALGLPAPRRPSEHAFDALAAAAARGHADPRLAKTFERAKAMLEMREGVRVLRTGSGWA